MIRRYDFKCISCHHIEEQWVDHTDSLATCLECGGRFVRWFGFAVSGICRFVLVAIGAGIITVPLAVATAFTLIAAFFLASFLLFREFDSSCNISPRWQRRGFN